MNKQELIKKYEMKGEQLKEFPIVAIGDVLKNLRELDEPEKVKIPQFVADVIEGAREQSPELEDALHYTWGNGTEEFTEWYKKKSNRDLFARAWLDGYEIEKEKRYLVKLKGLCRNHETLNCEKHSNEWLFSSSEENRTYKTKHTRKELEEANFGWVFDCEGVEIEEVE